MHNYGNKSVCIGYGVVLFVWQAIHEQEKFESEIFIANEKIKLELFLLGKNNQCAIALSRDKIDKNN